MNSLREAYTLAHSAQCRLNIEASRPDRNLRYVVGHLMHYESLRLRIVEIEHDISKSARASQVQFKGTGHVDHRLQHKPSPLGRKSPPPPQQEYDDDDEDDILDDFLEDDEDVDGLSLARFPSGSARPPQPPPPELEPDNPEEEDEDFDDEPASPEEPDEETLAQAVKGDGNELMATMYESVRKCSCHGKSDASSFERMWELPPDKNNPKQGITRAVAQIREDDSNAPHIDCTAQPLTASA